jgi:Rad3-related DNA helicase
MSGGGGVAAGAGDRQPRVLKIRGCDVSFPHKPYPSQLAMMDKTIQALKNSQNVLLELPTGSGKSLSLLCAAAAWHVGAARELELAQAPAAVDGAVSCKGEECDAGDERAAPKKRREKPKRPPKVYIASRTHAQLAQLVRELRKSGYSNVHMQVLGSRDQYCISPKRRSARTWSTKTRAAMCTARRASRSTSACRRAATYASMTSRTSCRSASALVGARTLPPHRWPRRRPSYSARTRTSSIL